jgi:hypothetical protein
MPTRLFANSKQSCKAGLEQYCLSFPTLTYNAPDKVSGGVTYGGYSDSKHDHEEHK